MFKVKGALTFDAASIEIARAPKIDADNYYDVAVARGTGTLNVAVHNTDPDAVVVRMPARVLIQPLRWAADPPHNDMRIRSCTAQDDQATCAIVTNVSKFTSVFGDALMEELYAEIVDVRSRVGLPLLLVLVGLNVLGAGRILFTLLRKKKPEDEIQSEIVK